MCSEKDNHNGHKALSAMSVYQMTKWLGHPQIVVLKIVPQAQSQFKRMHIPWCKQFPPVHDNAVLTALFAGLSHHKNLHVESSLLWHATNKFYLMTIEFGIRAVQRQNKSPVAC